MKLVKNRHHICWLVLKIHFHAVRHRKVKGLGIVYSYISSATCIKVSLLVILLYYYIVNIFIIF